MQRKSTYLFMTYLHLKKWCFIQIRGKVYSFGIFRALHSKTKRTLNRGTDTVTYRGSQICNSILDNLKILQKSSKKKLKRGKTNHVHSGSVKPIYKNRFYPTRTIIHLSPTKPSGFNTVNFRLLLQIFVCE